MTQAEQPFYGDRPIEIPSEDRLGFGPAAKHVAEAIHKMASPDGFVIGIEGEWGSGKSSFINLVSNALSKSGNAPEVVRFLPWLISSRDGLLQELFTEITKAVLRVDSRELQLKGWRSFLGYIWPKRYSAQAVRKRKIKGLFSRFSSRLVQAGKMVELFGLPGVGAVMEVGKRTIEKWLGNNSLEKEKSYIQNELVKLNRKIVVFIDDLDRLEPNEVVEVLRLVRAVVDFPNIVYVLCYSREIIASNLSTSLHIKKGDEFLEKIIQVSFSVPQPEAFDLRRMFRNELNLLYPDLLSDESPQAQAILDRLTYVMDDEGGRALLTPRHVVRAINALRFHATPVLDCIDIPDMVWLQLIYIQSPKLYKWIEGYLIGFAALHAGATISEEGKKTEYQKLNLILDDLVDIESSRQTRYRGFYSVLPGVDFDFEGQGDQQKMLLGLYGREDVDLAIRQKRLGSPQHFRYYFALAMPQDAMHDTEYLTFLESAQRAPEAAQAQFLRMATTITSPGRVAAQALLDRLKGNGLDEVSSAAIPGILEALASSMDAAALKTGPGDWGRYWVWEDAETILKSVWLKVSEQERAALILRMFGDGMSLGWLTKIFRRETYAHGVYGHKPKPESERLLSVQEYEAAAKALLCRYRNLTPLQLRQLPYTSDPFYAWLQFEPQAKEEVLAKVQELSCNDEDFLALLQGMRGWLATNGVVSFPLRESSLSEFMEFDSVRERLEKLSLHTIDSVARQARGLLEAMLKRGDE